MSEVTYRTPVAYLSLDVCLEMEEMRIAPKGEDLAGGNEVGSRQSSLRNGGKVLVLPEESPRLI